jgi:hypothetical protein
MARAQAAHEAAEGGVTRFHIHAVHSMAEFSNQDIRLAIQTLREHTTRTLRVNLETAPHAAK